MLPVVLSPRPAMSSPEVGVVVHVIVREVPGPPVPDLLCVLGVVVSTPVQATSATLQLVWLAPKVTVSVADASGVPVPTNHVPRRKLFGLKIVLGDEGIAAHVSPRPETVETVPA